MKPEVKGLIEKLVVDCRSTPYKYPRLEYGAHDANLWNKGNFGEDAELISFVFTAQERYERLPEWDSKSYCFLYSDLERLIENALESQDKESSILVDGAYSYSGSHSSLEWTRILLYIDLSDIDKIFFNAVDVKKYVYPDQ